MTVRARAIDARALLKKTKGAAVPWPRDVALHVLSDATPPVERTSRYLRRSGHVAFVRHSARRVASITGSSVSSQ